MEFIWRLSYSIWWWMQKHEWTFRFVLWLKQMGVVRVVKHWLVRHRDAELRKHPNEAMKNNANYFDENKKRVERVLSLLADEKSKKVLGGAIAYRTRRSPWPPELFSEDDQYFVRDLVRVEDGEVFLDGGAYMGDTIEEFLAMAKKENANFNKIIALEPDKTNYQMLKNSYGTDQRIILLQKGLSDKSGTLYFQENANFSRLTEDEELATTKVPVVAIDDLPECDEITWIKMDIEGAESDALEGARGVIRRNHPKLTICIYHSNEDVLRIIEQVHEMAPEYKLYVRHHSIGDNETVLYAVI